MADAIPAQARPVAVPKIHNVTPALYTPLMSVTNVESPAPAPAPTSNGPRTTEVPAAHGTGSLSVKVN